MTIHKIRFYFLAVICLINGCASPKVSPSSVPEKFDTSRYYARSTDNIARQEISLDRTKLKSMLSRADSADRIRLVELFSGSNVTPRYRVLNFEPNGAYSLLGLKIGDVILAADNFIIKDPALFPKFVGLMSEAPSSTIHILRGGKELILSYTTS